MVMLFASERANNHDIYATIIDLRFTVADVATGAYDGAKHLAKHIAFSCSSDAEQTTMAITTTKFHLTQQFRAQHKHWPSGPHVRFGTRATAKCGGQGWHT